MFQLLYVVEILAKTASEKQQGMVSDNADYFPITDHDVSVTCCNSRGKEVSNVKQWMDPHFRRYTPSALACLNIQE